MMASHSTVQPVAMTLAIAVACAALSVQVALAQPTTTTPGTVYTLKVVITNTSISIAKDSFTRNGASRYPRGAIIHYAITNKGNRTYSFRIWDETTNPIRPGGHDSVLVNWNYRGSFVYETLFNRKPVGVKGTVSIF